MNGYNGMEILLLLGIGQGLFLSLTLSILHNKNVAANRVLSLQLFVSCLILFTRMMLHRADEIWVVQRLAPMEALIFVLAPLGYIYLKRLLEKGQAQYRLSILHYIPALIYLGYLLYINSYSNEEFGRRMMDGSMGLPFFIAELGALLFNISYWFFGARFFLKALNKEKDQLSFRQSALLFVKILVIGSGGILSAWAIGFVGLHGFHVIIPIINYNLVWAAIPILIYIVGFFALRQPELFRLTIEEPKVKVKKRMDEKDVVLLKEKLTQLMSEEKVYLDNELTLVHLSGQLNTSTNNLSWLLNSVYQSNFYDFVNRYRIKAFLSKLEQNEHKAKTLLSLSMDVGFNSKSTFNKAFKMVLNETPSSYIKRLAS